MEQKEPEKEANNECVISPDGTIATDLPEEPADAAEKTVDLSEEPVDLPEEQADAPEKTVDLPEEPADAAAEANVDVRDEMEISSVPETVADLTEEPAELPEQTEPEMEGSDEPETVSETEAPEASSDLTEDPDPDVRIEHGYCDICEKEVDFRIDGEFLRDHFVCTECKSLPRQRAFLHALKMCCPNWRTACMHESSPGGPSSDFLFRNAKYYSISHYYPDLPSGEMGPEGAVCEDLEKMSYPDNVFDVFITQDVMEHIFDVPAAFNEIKRVLRPGGFYLFTVPYYKDLPKSFRRAKRLEDGSIRLYSKAVYHGNPVDDKGALVTWDYGSDFPELFYRMCGLYPVILRLEARYFGLDGEMMEVFMMRKPRKKTDPSEYIPPAYVFRGLPSNDQPLWSPFVDILPPEEEKESEKAESVSEQAETAPVQEEPVSVQEETPPSESAEETVPEQTGNPPLETPEEPVPEQESILPSEPPEESVSVQEETPPLETPEEPVPEQEEPPAPVPAEEPAPDSVPSDEQADSIVTDVPSSQDP